MTDSYLWWQKGIIYQIYPRSYQDSNNDGVGDLKGITRRLDYIKKLNVDAIWLSPIYPSPMHDFGYDVANYTDIHPMFGDMGEFDHFLEEVHQRELKLILDLVPNHTSDEHAWFIESRSNRENPKRNWYIWRDPAPDGGPPNNWISYFGGSAWTLDPQTNQYYLHQFVSQQPELNYRHPEVLTAILDVMRFWLEKGVDGFRMDAIWLLLKDEQFRDEPPNLADDGKWGEHGSLNHIYTANMPGIHGLIRQMRAVLDEYDDRMMVGEINLPLDKTMLYYGQDLDECHLPYNFQLIMSEWKAQAVRRIVDNYEAGLPEGAWPNWVLGNHDQHRIATRVGQAQAGIANMLLLTLRGTPTTYYGEEIGMENVAIPPKMIQDPPALNQPEVAHLIGRDPERTPMQWDDTPNAGFTPIGVSPWLPLPEDYSKLNVRTQEQNPTSMLRLYQALTSLRRAELALCVGDYSPIDVEDDRIFAYCRSFNGTDSFMVVLNFSKEDTQLDLGHYGTNALIEISTHLQRHGMVNLHKLHLSSNEGLVIRLTKK